MAGISKTNDARLLEAAGVQFELVPYEVDESNLAADHVAAQLGEPVEQVFKTLVLRGDRNGLFVCVMPGDMEVDLKVAAKISGNKSCAMIHVKELLPETGYIREEDVVRLIQFRNNPSDESWIKGGKEE